MTASVVAAITISNMNSIVVNAAPSMRVKNVLPQAGFTYALGDNQVSLSNLQESIDSDESKKSEGNGESSSSSTISKSVAEKIDSSSAVTDVTPSASSITNSILRDIQAATSAVSGDEDSDENQTEDGAEEENYDNLVVADVNDYVNIRETPDETSKTNIVGKLRDKSVGRFIKEEGDWCQIKSGKVTGWVKKEFCIIGQEAVQHAMEDARVEATIVTTDSTLRTRQGPSLDDKIMGFVTQSQIFTVLDQVDGWAKISMEEGDAWISTDYVEIKTVFTEAISKEEEEEQLAREKAELEANKKAASKATSDKAVDKNYRSAASYTTETSSIGAAVSQFAQQFVGNPYKWGGTSLTDGADCSGFVMSVYKNFGVTLPHSSGADRSVGAAVDGLANAQPGDIVCYSGHVAIYIGNGQIVHASTAKTGIKISDANYRKVLAVRRIL